MAREFSSSKGVVSLFARHHNAANLLMILMIIMGVFSLGRINTQFFPTIETKIVRVTIVWSGASAEDVETNILQIVEPEVRFIDGVDKMTSYAKEGSASMVLEFAPDTDMRKATSDVESAVKAITNLPEDSETPKINLAQFYDRVARLAITGPVPETALRIYAKIIRDDLIDRGIDKVDFVGLRSKELQVEIPERELRRLGLTISDISKTITNNSRDLPSGQMKGQVEKQLRAVADVKNANSLRRLEIRSFETGEKVTLGDVAKIYNGFKDGESRGFSNGQRAIQITVQRTAQADTLATAKILDDYLTDIEGLLPPAIILKKYEIRADALVERISLLVRNGLTGLALVVLTLFIFLNARIAFWVAAGIPVAMLATIAVMFAMGQSVNMISLFALIMMLGVIVDDAIVVGEHTATRFSNGDGPFEAAETGAGRMVVPVFAAMITTAAAFAPILMIRDVIGQIMGVMPMVVIAVIIASLVECFLILPGHLAHALKPRPKRRWSYWRHLIISFIIGSFLLAVTTRSAAGSISVFLPDWFSQFVALKDTLSLPKFAVLLGVASLIAGAVVELLIFILVSLSRGVGNLFTSKTDENNNLTQEGPFRRGFDKAFDRFRDGPFSLLVSASWAYRYVTVAIAIGSVMVIVFGLFISGGYLKFVFFPTPEAENIRARMVFNAGISEQRALEIIQGVENSLYNTVDGLTDTNEELVAAVFVTLGAAGRNTGDNLAEMRVQLTSSEVRSIRTPQIVKAWRRALPKMAGTRRISISESRAGPPGRDIDLELYGNDADILKKAASEVEELVAALPGTNGVANDLPFGKPELVMTLLPRGAALGFNIDNVGRQIRDAFEGAIPRRFARGDDEVSIRITRTSKQIGASALRNFELKSPGGEFVPLTEVVGLTERQGFSTIQRRNGKTTVSVTADLDSSIITTADAIEQLNAGRLGEVVAKYGLDYQFTGRAEERKKAFADLQLGVMIALSVIYIVLAWVFSDYWRPLAIMLIIPFGLVGAVFGHWWLDYNLTILSFIGLLGLSGILVNDSIILVSRMDERLEDGESLGEAAIGASKDRLRAVLLTSLTTIGGLIPLLFEKSLQAQFLLPMAITLIFGLALATLLVLFLVPAIIGIGADIATALRWIFDGRTRKVELQPGE